MLRAAAASGVATVAATPHLGPHFPRVRVGELADRCGKLRDAAGREGIEIRVVSGAEVSLVWALEASDEELRLATYEQRGTDLLIETPPIAVVGLDRLLYGLRVRGLRITLAHPERSHEFQREPARLEELVREGILLQLDADTLLGDTHRSARRRLGRGLCLKGLVHAVSSDGHRASSWRAITRLAQAAETAAALVGEPRAEWMTVGAPAAVIAGRELPDQPAVVPERRRRWPLRRRSA